MRVPLSVLALVVSTPAWAGPNDPWTIDPAKSRVGFSVEQLGKLVAGRIATWSSVSRHGDDYVAQGKLTIRGVTRDVTLPFSLRIQDGHATARGRLAVKRLDYGVGRNEWATSYVDDDVTIDITVVASRP